MLYAGTLIVTRLFVSRLEKEKARRRGKVYNWKTTTYGKILYDEDVHDLGSIETEFPAINIDEESDDEDYMVTYEKNSFSYKIIFVDDLKMDSENDNDKVNMPSFPSPDPTVSYFNDLDFLKDFENEFPAIVYNDALTFKLDSFPAIVYNDALTSKLDSSTEPVEISQHIDEFNLKDETSLSECDE
ncbi:hypothetical protein Tco_1180722 [Tanacetum coccineum]